MKNQGIKFLLLDIAEMFKRLAMEVGDEESQKEEEKVEEAKDVKEVKDDKKAKDEKPEIDFITVRKICAEKVEKDKNLNDEIREIIRSYGVRTLSEIDSKYYAEIIERVSKL